MNTRITALVIVFLLAAGGSGMADDSVDLRALVGADHHMHIRSAQAAAAWDAVCERMPAACPEGMRIAPVTGAADAIEALDEAGLDGGAMLSLGYFFGMPELAGTAFDSAALVREENAYVAGEAAKHPERLAGFFSVNPLADYAVDEVACWAADGGLVGLKLHLANSNVDLRDPGHLAQLQAVFQVLNEHAMPAVVHLRNRSPDYGSEDAVNFIEQVASQAPNVPLYVAHLGGWGGFDPATDAALQAFVEAMDRGVIDRGRVWFDTAALVHPSIPVASLEAVPARLREIGLDRVLFATDWERPEEEDAIERYRAALPLTDTEWAEVLSNRAPYFDTRP